MRRDFSHTGGRAIHTNAASGDLPPHGHDPRVDRLAACPPELPHHPSKERRAEYSCLMTGQENERGAPYSHFLNWGPHTSPAQRVVWREENNGVCGLRDILSRSSKAEFVTTSPNVEKGKRATPSAGAAFSCFPNRQRESISSTPFVKEVIYGAHKTINHFRH